MSEVCLINHRVIVLPHPIPESTPVDLVNESNLNASHDSILIEIDSSVQESELNTVIKNVSSLSSINNPITESTPIDLVSESDFNASGDLVQIEIDSSAQESESNAINNGSSQSNVELSNSSNENNSNGIRNKEDD